MPFSEFIFYFPAEMFGFQLFDPATSIIPHHINITSITSETLNSLQRGRYIHIENDEDDYDCTTMMWPYFYEPPAIELYTKFSLATYFLTFWGILILQTMVISILDKVWVRTIPKCATLWGRIIHAIVKSHFAFPYENWHDTVGNCQDHKDRQKAAKHEVLVTMVINLVFNMAMLVPLVILCKTNFIAKIIFLMPLLMWLFDDFYSPQNPWKTYAIEWPMLWRIMKNSLHNEGTCKWVNWAPIFFWYELLPTTSGPQKFEKIGVLKVDYFDFPGEIF